MLIGMIPLADTERRQPASCLSCTQHDIVSEAPNGYLDVFRQLIPTRMWRDSLCALLRGEGEKCHKLWGTAENESSGSQLCYKQYVPTWPGHPSGSHQWAIGSFWKFTQSLIY